MEAFFERLIVRAATIDELLSSNFEPLPGQKGDTDKAALRLSAWCRSCASGDWALFARRLDRDRLSIAEVLQRLATVRSRFATLPIWIHDAVWIESAMRSAGEGAPVDSGRFAPCAFESILIPVVEQADARVWLGVDGPARIILSKSARHDMRHNLLMSLSNLCAPAVYECFARARKSFASSNTTTAGRQLRRTEFYDQFIGDLRGGGLRQLFEEKPVLLRVISTTTRQWIDSTREFLMRIGPDLKDIRCHLLPSSRGQISAIEGNLSDPHNGGRSVQIVHFADGERIVYKPKDLRLDAAWHALVMRLNEANAPIELNAARVVTRDGYGWVEFVHHQGCIDAAGVKQFFLRAGAWLALFYLFAGTDMHQENMIAAADHPIPIDLEMILQPSPDEKKSHDAEAKAFESATDAVTNSVMSVGLLPIYERAHSNEVFATGGLTTGSTTEVRITWNDINTDKMRPIRKRKDGPTLPNLPHFNGDEVKFGDYIDDFVAGFEIYARFLIRLKNLKGQQWLFGMFTGLPVRKIQRPTRFYYMLLERLRNYKTMDDGAVWSAQVDFLARFANWDKDSELLWPLQHSERQALLQLNLPYFISVSDDSKISDAAGTSVRTDAVPGLVRALARSKSFDEHELAWQVSVIRQNTNTVARSNAKSMIKHRQLVVPISETTPTREIFVSEATRIAGEIASNAIRSGPGAAWVGLDWLGDSEIAQLLPLGPDLYNGTSGIALFLAAHAKVSGSCSSKQLALAAMANVRKSLKGRNAARFARSLGIGGACGLGSIVYALAIMANCLCDEELLADAHQVAALFTDDLIAADKLLDVIDGTAGAILALLRLYRDTQSTEVLSRAIKCGEHLLAQPRVAANGHRSWISQGARDRPLNGISHGSAGFAYALACLSTAAKREDFASASAECITFENSTFDAVTSNWRDLRPTREGSFSCQWCHGAPGIGLARIGMIKLGTAKQDRSENKCQILDADARNALVGCERGWPHHFDTMCCGTLGSIEFFREAADTFGVDNLRDIAARRMLAIVESATLTSGYRFTVGSRQFNLGLFQGLAGVGYACLRQADPTLPNILIWE